jgi:hypothetical protein
MRIDLDWGHDSAFALNMDGNQCRLTWRAPDGAPPCDSRRHLAKFGAIMAAGLPIRPAGYACRWAAESDEESGLSVGVLFFN